MERNEEKNKTNLLFSIISAIAGIGFASVADFIIGCVAYCASYLLLVYADRKGFFNDKNVRKIYPQKTKV